VVGYVEFETIVEAIDARYADEIDSHLGIERDSIARLRDRAYFAQQSTLVSEDLKTIACISSPEHRILITTLGEIPPLFVKDLLVTYVNMPYFGRGQYGIQAASRGYFGKDASELTLPQVAFLVSLINRPALPDRPFAADPSLRSRDEIRDANWSETARGTIRV